MVIDLTFIAGWLRKYRRRIRMKTADSYIKTCELVHNGKARDWQYKAALDYVAFERDDLP